MTIDIANLNKAAVLAALYNNSRQQGAGFLHKRGREPMTVDQAREELVSSDGQYFDYLHGRVMKISLRDNKLHVGLCDRDNGQGAAAEALRPLIEGQGALPSGPNIKARLSSGVLLGLGLYVIETRSRNRNKDLGPWEPSVGFADECNADQYLHQYGGIGYMRILRPND